MKYDVAKVCIVTLKPFRSMGVDIPEFQMKVMTAASKRSVLKVECTGKALVWICNALQANPSVFQ